MGPRKNCMKRRLSDHSGGPITRQMEPRSTRRIQPNFDQFFPSVVVFFFFFFLVYCSTVCIHYAREICRLLRALRANLFKISSRGNEWRGSFCRVCKGCFGGGYAIAIFLRSFRALLFIVQRFCGRKCSDGCEGIRVLVRYGFYLMCYFFMGFRPFSCRNILF